MPGEAAGVLSPESVLQIADVLETGCLIVDESLVIRGWNRWMESASGMTAPDVLGRAVPEVFNLADGSVAVVALQRALAGEPVVLSHQFHQYMLPLSPGPGYPRLDYMQQSARVLPHSLESGQPGALALVQNVTERVARESELNDARERAESASKAKSEFLAAISHELRTPLTAILGYADLMQSEIGGTLNALQHDHLKRIMAGTWHLIHIIDEILSFSRVEAKKYEVALEPLNFAEVVHDVVGLLHQQAEAKGIQLNADLPREQVLIETDSLKLRQILVNVIGNAIKFTEAGSITVQARADDRNVYCRTIDTGGGIPVRMQSLIFEPFVQADQTSTRAKGGTGLGLALSRGLAELLGGNLQLESSGPEGSIFLLTLPLHAPFVPSGNPNVSDVDSSIRVL